MRKVLVTLDFKGVSEKVLDAAQTWAKVFEGEIIILNVDPIELDNRSLEIEPVMSHRADDIKNQILANVQMVEEKLSGAGVAVRHILKSGTPQDRILDVAESENVDLIVMGSNKHSAAYRFLIGSVADQVIKKSKIPVLLIPSE